MACWPLSYRPVTNLPGLCRAHDRFDGGGPLRMAWLSHAPSPPDVPVRRLRTVRAAPSPRPQPSSHPLLRTNSVAQHATPRPFAQDGTLTTLSPPCYV